MHCLRRIRMAAQVKRRVRRRGVVDGDDGWGMGNRRAARSKKG
jgi:hypothetical protein